MKLKKLNAEYESRIVDCEILIESAQQSIRDLRKKNLSTKDYHFECSEFLIQRKINETKKQCYIQFLADINN